MGDEIRENISQTCSNIITISIDCFRTTDANGCMSHENLLYIFPQVVLFLMQMSFASNLNFNSSQNGGCVA